MDSSALGGAPSTGTTSTTTSANARTHHHDYQRDHEPEDAQLERKVSQAIDEGHDADIPSSAGFIPSNPEHKSQAASIASKRRRSNATRPADHDVEKGALNDDDDAAAGTDINSTPDGSLVVWWESDDDPQNPYNWPVWKKFLNCLLISLMTFVSPLGSSIFAPGVPDVMKEFQSSSLTLASFVVSVYVLGFAFGPLFVAPLSEIYGRVPVYHIANVLFTVLCVACALAPSLNALIVFRFICGVFGCASVTNGGGTIADMIKQESRGAAMAAYSLGPLLGPIIGPVAGGFITQSLGWRWTFWILAILGGAITVASFFVLQESYAYVILQRKTKQRCKETGNDQWRSKLDAGLSDMDFFKRGIIRPVKMFVKSPIILLTCVFTALVYGYLYLMFTTITTVFQETYGFSTGTVGLAFLGLGVGNLIGLFLFSATSDKYIRRKAAEADKLAEETGAVKEGLKPEYRLPIVPFGAVLIPIGLIIYGWTAQYKIQYMVPIIAHAIIGIGNLICFMGVQVYVVDAFSVYAASAIASNTVIRSIAGALLPLAGLPMFETLGVGWGNTLLGLIALTTVPGALLLIKYGEYLRKKYEIKNL